MLKRLELIGFKSFADRTRFDFAPGITAVVGPNGSGKSNIVDAVRWLLGEQSAKTLRGGEMADVIFNGSSTRKSLGMAEATVTFDNTRRLLAVDADEVQITRRVYRDGTGEYVINGQDARLKDIKDAFLGSGAGSNGYTIIAQGRVDELLAASTKDRREIFEEAAGISRFKAKKTETLRKLASVEQNLLRSKDRLDTLDQQLRTLRLQAAKAQRFKEHSDRLRELRIGLGQREHHELTHRIESEDTVLRELKADVSVAAERTDELERRLSELDREIAKTEESLRGWESRIAETKQQIAGHESTLKHERAAAAEHEAELLRVGKMRADLGQRVKLLEADTAKANAEAAAAAERLQSAQEAADAAGRELDAVAERLAALDREAQADRERQFEVVSRAAALQSQADSHASQLEKLRHDHTRKRAEADQVTSRRTALEHALDELSRVGADVQQKLAAARDRATSVERRREEMRAAGEELQAAIGTLRMQRSDLRARIDVLEDLERSLEGLGTGVREVLTKLSDDSLAEAHPELITNVIGLVADLFTVPREVAPLIDLALGDAVQRFVVRDATRLDSLIAVLGPLEGRVGFVPLGSEAHSPAVPTQLAHPSPAFPPTADSYVRCDPLELTDLPRQLLGDVVVVNDLNAGRRWQQAALAVGRRLRFLTLSGELLEPDGSLTVGSLLAGAGIVSRKSELRELKRQLVDLDQQIVVADTDLAALRQHLVELDASFQSVETEVEVLAGEAGDLQQQISRQQQLLEQLAETIELLEQECGLLAQDIARGDRAHRETREAASEAEREAAELRDRLEANGAAVRLAQDDLARRQQEHTDARVAASQATAEHERSRERIAQLEAESRKRRIEAVDLSAADRNARGRQLTGLLAMLRASSGMADAYRENEDLGRQVAVFHAQRTAEQSDRERVAKELHELRSMWQERQTTAHTRELAVHDLTARRDSLVQRLRDDYGIELGAESSDVPDLDPLTTQPEIDDLKRKLARLGSVNMEALEELTRVEAEANALTAQHDDLAGAQKSLREIIDQINGDSRKLFAETLSAVRGYFQELFRKLFAGGQADIVLEDEADILESGIEITARPPGKELRSISLLSGGEKTLTAIALLLAIFRNKPSPFCLLDEVDAALDEANTQRLAGLLLEFRQQSQFVVITHKKRTMAVAEVLHGVTMQESGVSKQAAMRFEDWPDDERTLEKAA